VAIAQTTTTTTTTTAPAAVEAPEPTPQQWRAFASQDVQAAYEIYVANHPGMHDRTNPGFRAQLGRARKAGLKVARTAADSADYQAALGAFSAELGDGHAQAFGIQPQTAPGAPVQREWPGFVATFRGKDVLVHHAGPTSPAPAGSIIKACDGKPATDVVKGRLLTFGFRPKEAGLWWARTQQAFLSTPSSQRGRPERCTFRTPDGKQRIATLAWGPTPENFNSLMGAASDGERTAIGLTEPRPGFFLVGLPDFQPNEEGVKAYRALYEALRARREELKSAKAVVLDLRFNNGGSSSWPGQAAQALWGDEPVTTAMAHYFNKVRIWWRASEGNIADLSKTAEQFRANGDAAGADRMEALGKEMAAARAKGEHYYVQGGDQPVANDLPPVVASDFKTPVYVITPGRCASACLDAVDIFTRFDNVTLIGAPTSADTTYMEVRYEILPSGKGRIVIPNKMWIGRPRASGQVYQPKILVTDLDWSTATFLNRIERDLAARR
jgi:hypothetical protein